MLEKGPPNPQLQMDPSEQEPLCEFSYEKEIQEKKEMKDQGLLVEEKKVLEKRPMA